MLESGDQEAERPASASQEKEAAEEVEQEEEDSKTHPPRIRVSIDPLRIKFYANLGKKLLKQHDEVRLSGIGGAVLNVVSVAEILKAGKLATAVRLCTSYHTLKDKSRSRPAHKAKMEILMLKTSDFDSMLEEQKREARERRLKREAKKNSSTDVSKDAAAGVKEEEEEEEEERVHKEERESEAAVVKTEAPEAEKNSVAGAEEGVVS